MRRSGETSITSMARGLLDALDRGGEGRGRADIIRMWRIVAGPEVYSHARGFALRAGELVVFVDSHAWAADLTIMSSHYLAALQEATGKDAVTSLRFTVSRKVAEDKRRDADDPDITAVPEEPPVETVEATEHERQQLAMMAAGIHDDDLRESVIAAAIAQLQWRKGIEARNAAERGVQRARGTNPTAQR